MVKSDLKPSPNANRIELTTPEQTGSLMLRTSSRKKTNTEEDEDTTEDSIEINLSKPVPDITQYIGKIC